MEKETIDYRATHLVRWCQIAGKLVHEMLRSSTKLYTSGWEMK